MKLKDLNQRIKISSKISGIIAVIGLVTGIFGVYTYYNPLPKGHMGGVVYDIETGKPLPSVRIYVISRGSADTDSNGNYSIKIFESFNIGDTITLMAQHEDYLSEESVYVVDEKNIIDTIYLSPLVR